VGASALLPKTVGKLSNLRVFGFNSGSFRCAGWFFQVDVNFLILILFCNVLEPNDWHDSIGTSFLRYELAVHE
jgi:hypothetical protein